MLYWLTLIVVIITIIYVVPLPAECFSSTLLISYEEIHIRGFE